MKTNKPFDEKPDGGRLTLWPFSDIDQTPVEPKCGFGRVAPLPQPERPSVSLPSLMLFALGRKIPLDRNSDWIQTALWLAASEHPEISSKQPRLGRPRKALPVGIFAALRELHLSEEDQVIQRCIAEFEATKATGGKPMSNRQASIGLVKDRGIDEGHALFPSEILRVQKRFSALRKQMGLPPIKQVGRKPRSGEKYSN